MEVNIKLQKHHYHMILDMLNYLEIDGEIIKCRTDYTPTNVKVMNGYTFVSKILECNRTKNYAWWLQFRDIRVVD